MSKQKKTSKIKAKELDRIFDEGTEDIMQHLDMNTANHPGLEAKRVNVDFPGWMVVSLDKQANRLGVARQALIKLWIAEKLESQTVL